MTSSTATTIKNHNNNHGHNVNVDVDVHADAHHAHLPPPPPTTTLVGLGLPLPLHPSSQSQSHRRGCDTGSGNNNTSYRCRSSSSCSYDNDHQKDKYKDAPGSISTSPASSKDSDFDTLLAIPIPPPPPPPPPMAAPETVVTGGRTPESISSASVSVSVSGSDYVPQQHQGSSATTATAISIEHDDENDHVEMEPETETEVETINLLNLASITLASTIIASKIIQKHSKLFSEANVEAESSVCSPNCSSSNSAIPCHDQPIHLQQQEGEQSNNNNNDNNNSTLPKSRVKTNGTIVTDADGESQRIITSYIKSISPHVRIVGEESIDEIQKSHLSYEKQMHTSKHNAWWGASPGSRRKLIKREERDEDYICEFVKMEVYLRYNMYKAGQEQRQGMGREYLDRGDDHQDEDQDETADFVGDEGDENDDDEINVNASRVSIFVDPLDGTSAYAKGDYEAVTILAGIMLDNVPIFGIIVKPFGHEGINVNFHKKILTNVTMATNTNNLGDGGDSGNGDKDNASDAHSSLLGFHCPCCALYGGTLLGGAFVVGGSELDRSRVSRTMTTMTSINIPQSPHPMHSSTSSIPKANRKAIISKSRGGGVVRQCIDSLSSKGLLDPEPIYITGAGYKTLRLVLGTHNETMWFFPKPGTSLWDVAAADALLRCMGGRISDKFGKDLDYSKSWTDADNLDGIIACSDSNLHAKCLQLYREEGWDD
eukprot:CAMPEP_0203674082 /NCGR_PEP_ID=MMETSP0090-20130426/14828_1 /ASSEMBLY_ACC=CAM_ASM_001088 /TAXON_ID=426623 /ORGANISM="Chaetoceros affinis, Strain CCMP159" /LENGTH=712 /DNA_ID=CAMNT_0050539863 /DNA_START=770 /DNA_END=2905 /DNA_ORIENTATION=-